MSTNELKYEINKVLDQFSDEALEELLRFLQELNAKQHPINADHLHKILSEDHNLLQRLAQ